METSKQSWLGMEFEAPIQDEMRPQHQADPIQQSFPCKKKMRDSCNNCAVSKVKCSKDRPMCKRCDDRGIFCQYSPSRRSGKRRRVFAPERTPAGSNTTSTGSVSPSPLDLDAEIRRDITSPFELRYPDVQKFEDRMMPWEYQFTGIDHGCQIDNSMEQKFRDFDGETLAFKFDATPSGCGFQSPLGEVLGRSDPTLTPSFTSPTSVPRASFQETACQIISNDSNSQTHSLHNCTMIALNILQSLHTGRQTCTWSLPPPRSSWPHPSSHSTTIDHILEANREAAKLVEDILCCSCSLDPQVWLLLVLIATRIIERYSSMAYDDNFLSPAKSDPILHLPIPAGRYEAQLALNELQGVSELVEKLATRFNKVGQREGAVADGSYAWQDIPEGQETSMLTELETFLRIRLRSATQQTMNVLQRI